jgi:AraC-like DNA-binding protein
MISSSVAVFNDTLPYQAALQGAQVELFPTGKGEFRAELTKIKLQRLWMQRGRENLPRIWVASVSPDRAAVGFLADADQPAVRHRGADVAPGEIIVDDANVMHRRTEAPCHWASMSLPPEDFAAAGHALAGGEMTVPSVSHLVRPRPALMARLLRLHQTAERLAKTKPGTLARPEVARALEQQLIHALVACLTEGTVTEKGSAGHHHAAVIARLEELLAANHDRALYLAEICAATGVSERTLRVCCQEHMGMGPVHYLWLRRMHLARRALVRADPARATVTEIATEFGFWELGRFSVAYRTLFGESPSASLRRPPADPPISHDGPFALPAAEFA